MVRQPEALWLTVSPSLRCFDRPLLQDLSKSLEIAEWEYVQDPDEGSSFGEAVALLHNYMSRCDRPLHLMGHGLGGVLGLTYARQYPERVRSLTLLAVAAQPAITWHAHYYVQRNLFPCSQQQVLGQTVRSLFGPHLPYPAKDLVVALKRDLEHSPCLHSLLKLVQLPVGGIAAPLLVCGSQTDAIVHPPVLQAWSDWLKPTDRLWQCPEGRHFFHYFYPQQVAEEILKFVQPWAETTRPPAIAA